jgi:hypothetical protein
MIGLTLFLLVGALLLFSLFFLTRRPKPLAAGGKLAQDAVDGAELAISALQSGLLPAETLARLFAPQDYDYACSAGREIRRLFLDERQRLVLSWIGQVHKQIASLRRFHLGTARYHARLKLSEELRLAADFATLAVACRSLQLLVFMCGPCAAPRITAATAQAAGRVCAALAASLDILRPARPLAANSLVV